MAAFPAEARLSEGSPGRDEREGLDALFNVSIAHVGAKANIMPPRAVCYNS